MRAPTLQRWVHFRDVGGGFLVRWYRAFALKFFIDKRSSVARINTCPGDVAQLGERLGRIEEVEGSIPFVSTTGFVKAPETEPFSL